jgi:NitT/TauT family transport system substrate-binding protein
MLNSPNEAATLAMKHAIDGQNPAVNLEIIKLRNQSSVSPLTQKLGLGALDVEALQKAAKVYRATGVIQREVKMSDLVAQDLLPGKR